MITHAIPDHWRLKRIKLHLTGPPEALRSTEGVSIESFKTLTLRPHELLAPVSTRNSERR
jgi:hypothetical protein